MSAPLLFGVSALVIALAVTACSAPEIPAGGDADDARLGQVASPVINGQLDTTHQAVVAIVLQEGQQGGLCSGTIVKTDPVTHIGWVLTAAHCVDIPPVFVLQGNDFAAPSGVLRYDIVDYKADPNYPDATGSPYDFAMIRIAGVDASTPTIPLVTSPDSLGVGTSVVSVGYGRTTLIAAGAGDQNTVRRRVSKQLSQVGQSIAYNMQSNGICQGDSGGPVIVGSGSAERVAGVHSYVQGDCNGLGVSGRVTFNKAFIDGELAKAIPKQDCDLCGKIANSGNGTCASATRNCLADKECGGYYECLSSGKAKSSCLLQFPKAEGPFNAAANCQCTQACTTECKGTFECINAPKCGYKLPAGACAQCTEGACCDEALECASDGACYVCLKTNDASPGCATNAARKKMATCVSSKCKTECAGSGLDTGAEPPTGEEPAADPNAATPAGGGTSSTTTTESCSLSSAPLSRGGRAAAAVPTATAAVMLAVALLARRRRRAA